MLNFTKKEILGNKPDWSFQDDAINRVVSDFTESPAGKRLIVIPTGGGKTIVGLRIVNELIKKSLLSSDKKIIWIVHTKWLKRQTEIKLIESSKKYNFSNNVFNILEIRMKDDARKILLGLDSKRYAMLIIDEAHHSAAAGYKDFFNPSIGILGLTATPARTDDLELDFDDISYSITFRELAKRNVILLPEFDEVQTHMTVMAKSINYYSKENDFNQFDYDARNDFIAEEIFKRKKKYKKVVIFVGTNNHVRKLYEIIKRKNEFYNRPFEHIGYIYGGDKNEQGITNDEYLVKHQKIESSILVNCLILNEGYDDPRLNTVVMATPSKSILYYMQCIGRVVRNPGENIDQGAYVLELVDKLPNIKYRIENRWLFAEISDYLEPEIIDIKYRNIKQFRNIIVNLLYNHQVKEKYKILLPTDINPSDFNLLLYADSPSRPDSTWKPLYFIGQDSYQYITAFNKISVNIKEYANLNDEFLFFSLLKFSKEDKFFKDREIRISLISSLERAYNLKNQRKKVDCLKYYTFNKEESSSFWNFIIKLINYLINL